jgi:hypothetical protein
MRRNWIWGLVLLLIGVLLLLDNLGYLAFLGFSVWQIIWPLALIAVGVGFLIGARRQSAVETQDFGVDLAEAAEASVHLDYGAGELRVSGGAGAHQLLTGTFEGGVQHDVARRDRAVEARLWSRSVVFWPWQFAPHNRRWRLQLNERIPLTLVVKTGASDCELDLTDLQVTRLRIESGASSTRVKLPAHAGYTEVRGSSGVASLTLRVPANVAARIHAEGGLSSIAVDRQRFPRQGGVYVSRDYETADNKVDIRIDVGVGSVDIR